MGLLLVSGACGSTSSPPSSPSGSAPSASAPSAAGSADDCPAISLVSPGGSQVELSGEWGGGEWFQTPGTNERTFFLQRGACVWASIMDDEFRADPQPQASQLAIFYGRLGSDFSIDGTLVVMMRWSDTFTYGNQPPGPMPFRLKVEFDADGSPVLREDRVPGVQGPRCPNPVMWCPDPTVLHLVSAPSASPSPAP